ncbi:MAG: sigma-70 family RNA polymerase sigma factor [Coprothermobacterota bacterium]|nr:sigma-70 family RNA polymerase sigma factor [Coprothermobacterota bacterium]
MTPSWGHARIGEIFLDVPGAVYLQQESSQPEVREPASGGLSAQERFEEFVRRYEKRLFALAYHYIGNHDRAEEIAQEAFLKAYLGFDRFRGEAQVFTWLYRIVVNLCIDDRRKRKPVEVPIDDLPISDGFDPDQTEREMVLREALGQLAEPLRACLVLHDMDGFSYQEMARILRLPLGTVMSRMNSARRKLRKILESQYPELRPEVKR